MKTSLALLLLSFQPTGGVTRAWTPTNRYSQRLGGLPQAGRSALRILILLGVLGGPLSSKAAALEMDPDYTGITLPPNIAPLNFQVRQPAGEVKVVLSSKSGEPISLKSSDGRVRFPPARWKALLEANAGQPLWLHFFSRGVSGQWQPLAGVTNFISSDPIDPYLSYRWLKPLYNIYEKIEIRVRHLETDEARPLFQNRNAEDGCMNCHSPLLNRPGQFAFHLRTRSYSNPMMVISNQAVIHVAHTAGYLSWHPSGQLLAASKNKLSLFFHTVGENRDVYDDNSDITIIDLARQTVEAPPALAKPEILETWPAWAPDGRHLYFCATARRPNTQFRSIRYDLMRASYDPANRAWAEPEVVVASSLVNQSFAQPRLSPDGKFLVAALAPYGNFPIYQPKADLYLLDLSKRTLARMALNSDQADTWHGWSSNGRWFVFSSKRRDGLLARPHFAHFDEQGRTTKPFILPQEDPAYYDRCIHTFNVPEFVAGPIPVSQREIMDALIQPESKMTLSKSEGTSLLENSEGVERNAERE